jgi:hypothetical protein
MTTKEYLHHSVEDCSGYLIERNSSLIISITSGSRFGPKISLGQLVRSSGRFFATKGTIGIVVGIRAPYTEGLTSNVFEVWFEGSRRPEMMKFKDLDL